MKCNRCHKAIDEDAQYCPYCGCEIIHEKEKAKRDSFYDFQYEENTYSDQSRNLFFIGFIAFDLILSTVLGFLGIPNVWVFAISAILYGVALYKGFKGIRFSLKLKKQGKPMSGLVTSLVIMTLSGVFMIMNCMSIINLF